MILLTVLFLVWFGWCLVWVVADLWLEFKPKPAPLPMCLCGRRILRGGFGVWDHSDCVLHEVGRCSPVDEVIWS